MTSQISPVRRLLAAIVLSAVVGLVGGSLAAWAIYARFGPVERVVIQSVQPGGSTGGNTALTVGAIADQKSQSVVEVVTQPLTQSSLLTGGAGLVDGFIVSSGGLVVTSIHAVRGAAALTIATSDGHAYPASVVRSDVVHGVVLLQAVGAQGLTPLSFASVTPKPGDVAIAVAHVPFSALTLSSGTVSSIGLTVSLDDGEPAVRDVLTVDATPDPREDGAPLLNGNGDVIGVVVDAAGAAPGLVALSQTAAGALVQGTSSAATPTLGADSVVIDAATAAAFGVPAGALLRSVTPGGPAAGGGLEVGDVVLSVNGTTIDTDHPFDASVLGLAPGEQVSITVYRAGTTRTVTLAVGTS